MGAITTVSTYIKENANELADEIVNQIVDRFTFPVPVEEVHQAKAVYTELLSYLADCIHKPEFSVPQSLIDWSRKNAEREAFSTGRISKIIVRYPDTRMVFVERMTQISMDHGLNPAEAVTINKRIHFMLDASINATVMAFEQYATEAMSKKQAEVNALSVPIVPIHDGIVVLPLIGEITEDRTDHILNTVIPTLSERDVEKLILDFSGIVTVDDQVASHIFTIYQVLNLLGIHVIVTGVRPDIATKVVTRGIDLSNFSTFANVKLAVASLQAE